MNTLETQPITNKAQHSPLPWRIRQPQTVGEAQQGERIESDCGFVCTLETRRYEANLTSESINESERKANAALIVRAVNHADKLAEALRDLIGKIEVMSGCMPVNYEQGNDECYPEFDAARAELAAWEAAQ